MDAPFDRSNIGHLEKPSSSDLNRAQAQIYRTICELGMRSLSTRTSDTDPTPNPVGGFLQDGFFVEPQALMNVNMRPGLGFSYSGTDAPTNIGTPDLDHVDDRSFWKPMVLNSTKQFAVPAAPSTVNQVRYDLIEAKYQRFLDDAELREQLDEGSLAFVDHTFSKTLSYVLDGLIGSVNAPAGSVDGISYKVGIVGTPGAVPAVTPGYVPIAVIRVPQGTTAITGDNIADMRTLLQPGGVASASIRFRLQWNAGAPIVTIRDVIAPPGMFFTVDTAIHGSSAVRGQCLIHLWGGNMVAGGGLAQVSDNTATKNLVAFPAPFAFPIGTWSDTAQSNKAHHTPIPNVGQGQTFNGLGISATALASPATGDSDDIEVYATMVVRY